MPENNQEPRKPRTARVILTDALDELLEHGTRLKRLEEEKNETDAGIMTLRKLLGLEVRSLTSKPVLPPRELLHAENGADRKFVPGALTRRIVALCKENIDMLSRDDIAQALGQNGRGLTNALNRAVMNGKLVEKEGCYGVASPIGQDDD